MAQREGGKWLVEGCDNWIELTLARPGFEG